jgi:hypothetical protein
MKSKATASYNAPYHHEIALNLMIIAVVITSVQSSWNKTQGMKHLSVFQLLQLCINSLCQCV